MSTSSTDALIARSRCFRWSSLMSVGLLLFGLVLMQPKTADGAGLLMEYRPPTDAPIVDFFRPPAQPWMSGNRGVDFGTAAGAQISAAAEGRVVFAGQVGGELHVTVEHDDQLRTTYSFLSAVTVSPGDRVQLGEVIGIAGGLVHFGVRTPDGVYLDPEALFAGTLRPRVRLVPGTDQGLERLGAQERSSLLDVFLDNGAAVLEVTSSWSTATATLVLHYAVELNPATHSLRTLDAVRQWKESQLNCTPTSVEAPVPTQRRIVVVVSGLGTSSDSNTAWEIDTSALGYADTDVVRYSYAGGQAPRDGSAGATDDPGLQSVATRPFDAIASRPFDAIDSQQSISTSADRLRVLLQSVSAAQPGVPVDVIAHSQGGVVARLAIERAGAEDQLPGEVSTLVTVSSPQQGAPLATTIAALADSPGGTAALSQLRAAGVADELDNRHPAIGDLAETSAVMDELHDLPMPDAVRFVTIGGSGDVVVPGTVAVDGDADASIILPTAVGKDAHGSLPSSPAATREIGLAIAGRGPTCQGLGEALGGFAQAESIRIGESMAGAMVAVAAGVLPVPFAQDE